MTIEVGDRVEQPRRVANIHQTGGKKNDVGDTWKETSDLGTPMTGTVVRVTDDRALIRWDSREVEWWAMSKLIKE